MEHVRDAKKHLGMLGKTMLEMSARVYVNCARCTKNIGVTSTYKDRMDAKFLQILCNDCRNLSEVTK